MAMRKIIMMILVLLLCSSSVLAADALYRMLYGDEVESFAKDQDAIVLFEVIESGHPNITAKVLHVISGKVEDEVITIENKNIRLMGMLPDSELHVGDDCVMSVKKYGNKYKQAWAALKADSGNYKTLKFYYSSHFSDIDALQYYVNSGGIEKDFSFDGVQVFVHTTKGEKKDITLSRTDYLPDDGELEMPADGLTDILEEVVAHEETESSAAEATERSVKNPFSGIVIGVVVAVGALGYGLGRLVRRG